MNFLQSSQTVNNKAAAVRFLQHRGILHNPRIYMNCFRPMTLNLRPMKRDRPSCSVRGCCRKIGLRKNTWLEYYNLLYRTIVLFLYGWSKEMTSVSFCEHEFGIPKATVIDWNNFLRKVCAAELLSHPIVIEGLSRVVKVDESLFSRRKKSSRSCATPAVGFPCYRSSITRMLYVHCARSIRADSAADHPTSDCTGYNNHVRYVGSLWWYQCHGIWSLAGEPHIQFCRPSNWCSHKRHRELMEKREAQKQKTSRYSSHDA